MDLKRFWKRCPCLRCVRLYHKAYPVSSRLMTVEIGTVPVRPFYAPDHDVVQGTRSIDSRSPWHDPPLSPRSVARQLKNLTASPFSHGATAYWIIGPTRSRPTSSFPRTQGRQPKDHLCSSFRIRSHQHQACGVVPVLKALPHDKLVMNRTDRRI